MKVANVMFSRGLGGIEQVFLDYAEALPAAGLECINITHPSALVLKQLSGKAHTVSNLGSWDPIARTRLALILKREKPDIVICHGNRAIQLLAPAARKGKAKLVGVAHNYWLKSFRACRAAIAITPDIAAHLETIGMPRAAIYHVPNMVRVAKKQPLHTTWPETPVIGTMGRMVEKKGFDHLLMALKNLADSGVKFRAVIAGDGPKKGSLAAQASALGLSDKVSFPGWVTDKASFWRGINLFCLPSRHEPFGIVLLEAMAEALPVVSTASEGPSAILPPELLVPQEDSAALAAALRDMLNDPATAAQNGSRMFEIARQQYSLPVVAKKLRVALEQIQMQP